MKKWTVMMIPHGKGATRNLSLCSFHLWLTVACFCVLAFASTFTFQLYRYSQAQVHELERATFQLRTAGGVIHRIEGITPDELAAIESKYREDYKKSIDSITSKLNRLYELESQIREVHDLPAKVRSSADYIRDGVGGVGGPPADLSDMVASSGDELTRPSNWIYGLSEPSADLIIQEIDLRVASLQELLAATTEKRERIACTPNILPTVDPRRKLSSRFGNRKDPFSKRLQFHTGLDISAPAKSSVLATAKGKVMRAERDGDLGNIVEIDHGYGFRTLYAHLYKSVVEVGDIVMRGDKVGLVGTTGRSTGYHVHYEVYKNGKNIDPETTVVN
ncbi:MAG TPA: M23 family metallopeptidase [Candidatus Hydrogenedentes bacterium]|nr:M23 family metallopeptidase [Candidatus Hydrogenedentota bacterium]HQE83466.1 M23 family metallopeptidase [Candidatus Hydrogenedentota bacterium]HQH53834.1 M23 family metallopeptidase [Candidatus Hydrogenedentota bacterium]HQM47159.1 M23 family metallopeptidase [Candidatus Hydrogenedentota bacterium]